MLSPVFQYTVDVQKGSGYFHVIPDQAGVVSLEYTDKTKQMQVIKDFQGRQSLWEISVNFVINEL